MGFTNCINTILTGLAASIFFSLIVYFIQVFRYWFYLKRRFHKKVFNTYWKRFPNKIVQTVTCRVNKNIIKFKGKKNNSNKIFMGQFIINPFNLKTAQGYHINKNTDGFAFIRMIIKDKNTFYVESPYTGVEEKDNKKKGFRVYQAFIWKKEQ